MSDGNAHELLGRGDVAMGCESREAIRMDTPLAPLSRPDTAFWLFRAHWTEALSLNRVSPTEEAGELCTGLSRDVDCDALQDGGSTQARIEGTGNG